MSENKEKNLRDVIKKAYAVHSEIRLNEAIVPQGETGIIEAVDDHGQVQVLWKNGLRTMMSPSKNIFTMLSKEIDVLMVELGKKAYQAKIWCTKDTIMDYVGGDYEEIVITDDVIILCNERAIFDDDSLVGSFIIAGYEYVDGREVVVSLTEEQIQNYKIDFNLSEVMIDNSSPSNPKTIKEFYNKYSDYYSSVRTVIDYLAKMYEIVEQIEYEEIGEKKVSDLQHLIDHQIIYKEIPNEQEFYEDTLTLLGNQIEPEKMEYIKEEIEACNRTLQAFENGVIKW